MPSIQFVPWRQVAYWRCNSCGNCCKDYGVVLNFPEWLRITQNFGAETAVMSLDKFFIRRFPDGSCAFLCRFAASYSCGLQSMKPNACKLWPFKVLVEPRYGEANQSIFDFCGKKLYVYADSNCCGLKYGSPTWEFARLTIREFVAIAMGISGIQRNSTRS
jgi:Fe-S-cluster containining protein